MKSASALLAFGAPIYLLAYFLVFKFNYFDLDFEFYFLASKFLFLDYVFFLFELTYSLKSLADSKAKSLFYFTSEPSFLFDYFVNYSILWDFLSYSTF